MAPQSRYDPEVAAEISRLFDDGERLLGRVSHPTRVGRWVASVEQILNDHVPTELKTFQTIGRLRRRSYIGRKDKNSISEHELTAKVNKLRLIMGRYEERQNS